MDDGFLTSDERINYFMKKDPRYGRVIVLNRKGRSKEFIWEGFTKGRTSYTWVETFNGRGPVMVCTKDLIPGHIGVITTKWYNDVKSVTILGFRTIKI